jgi:hypothetical protein
VPAFSRFERDAPIAVGVHREVRAQLLFIHFGEDHVAPPRLARATDGTKDDSSSIDEFVEFPGRPRFLCAPGWKDVADYALAWAVEHAIASTARGDASDSHEEKGESS